MNAHHAALRRRHARLARLHAALLWAPFPVSLLAAAVFRMVSATFDEACAEHRRATALALRED